MGFASKAMGFAGGGIGSLGFASTAGAFIGGAAKQMNQNIEEQQAQDRQDDVLQQAYTARADKAISDYKNTQSTYNGVYSMVGNNSKLADSVMSILPKNAKPADIEKAIGLASKNMDTTNDPNYTSSYLQNKRNEVDFTVGRLKPKYRNMLQMPDDNRPTQNSNQQASPFAPQGQPSSIQQPSQGPDQLTADQSANATPVAGAQPISLDTQPSGQPLSESNNPGVNPADNGVSIRTTQKQPWQFHPTTPSSTINKELLKPDDFNSPEDYRKYFNSVNADPMRPDLSGLRNSTKLDPILQGQLNEYNKLVPSISVADRPDFIKSIQEARQTGDFTKIRTDLIPTQADMDNQKNVAAAGMEASKKYSDDLIKRRGVQGNMRAMMVDTDRIIQMATDPSHPLQTGAVQPLLDQINRVFSSMGVDLRQLGLPVNRIEDINMFKKLIGDMTFDQISQYHLGRWTNYEVGILKEKLPSIDTDPNSMIKVSLLFRNAAERELQSYKHESEIAYGKNGENFFAPKDLGKAHMYGVDFLTNQPDQVPWAIIKPTDAQAYNALPNGSWYELAGTRQMGQKGGTLLPPSTTR